MARQAATKLIEIDRDTVALPRLLTLTQVAEYLQTPRETIRHWVFDGRLKAYKPGRKVLVKASDVLRLVEANDVPTARGRREQRRRERVEGANGSR